MKRGYGLLGALLLMALGVQCNAKVTIQYLAYDYNDTTPNPIYKTLVDEFNARNPGIQVKMVAATTPDKILSMMIAGTAPDVIRFDRQNLVEFAARNLLRKVDTILPKFVTETVFHKAAIKEGQWNGVDYSVPFTADTRGLIYNRRLISEAGLPDHGPKTWEDLEVYSVKTTKRRGNGRISQLGFAPWAGNWGPAAWLFTFGGSPYDAKAKEPTLNTQQNTKALAWVESWARKYGTADFHNSSGFGNYEQFMVRGTAAMVLAHGGIWNDFDKFPAVKPHISSCELPHPPGGRNGATSAGFSHAVPLGSRYPKQAAEFMRYLARPDVQIRAFRATGALPANRKAITDAKDEISPILGPIMAYMDELNSRPPFYSLIQGHLYNAFGKVENLKGDPALLLKQEQDAISKRWSILVNRKGR